MRTSANKGHKPTMKGVAMMKVVRIMAVTIVAATLTLLASNASAQPATCNKAAVQNSPAYGAYGLYFNKPMAQKCSPANISSLQGTSQMLQRVLTREHCSWADIAPLVVYAGPASVGCGGPNPPNAPSASSDVETVRKNPLYIPLLGPWSYLSERDIRYTRRLFFSADRAVHAEALKTALPDAQARELIATLSQLPRGINMNVTADKQLDAQMHKRANELIRKALASCTFAVDSAAITAKESEVAQESDPELKVKLQEELAALRNTQIPACPPDVISLIDGFIGAVSTLDRSKLSEDSKSEVGRLVDEARKAKRSDFKIAYASSALDHFMLSGPCDSCRGIGKAFLDKYRASSARVNKIPRLRLSFSAIFFSGSTKDRRHGRDFTVKSAGYGLIGSIGVEGVVKRWDWGALLAALDVGIGARWTYLRDETTSNVVESKHIVVQADVRTGINIKDWVSLGPVASFRPHPVGGEVGAFIELTRVKSLRVLVEGLYTLDDIKKNTGVPGSHAVNVRAPSVRLKLAWVL